MNMGNYAHGNQPIQHMIYLYNYSSQPWKAQYWLREVMERMYNANPDAIAVMRTTARHLLGTCFQLWDSIPSVRVQTSMCWVLLFSVLCVCTWKMARL